MKAFFTFHVIDRNVTFCLLTDSNFSASCPIPQGTDWKTHDSLTMMTVQNALLKVYHAVGLPEDEKYFLQAGVTFIYISVVNSGHDSG